VVVLLLGGRLHVGASLRELILGPRLRVLGLVTVLALLSRWSTGREGRSRKAKHKHGGEYVTHVGLPCCSCGGRKGIAAAPKWFQRNMSQESTAPDASASHLGTASKHSVQTLAFTCTALPVGIRNNRLCTQPLRKPRNNLQIAGIFVGSSIIRVAVAETRSARSTPKDTPDQRLLMTMRCSAKCHPTGPKTWQQHIDPRAAGC